MNASTAKKYDPLNCGTLWSYRGVEIDESLHAAKNTAIHNLNVTLDFKETPNRGYPWRTSLKDGQIPYKLIWPL